jgi:hypothetical protein
MEPKFVCCNCNPESDPYHQDTDGETQSSFWVDLETGKYGITQEYDDNAVPEPEWNGRTQTFFLSSRPSEGEAKAFLQSEGGVALIQTVLDNSEIVWDGNNMVGKLNEDGGKAMDELLYELSENISENEWSLWDANDWLYDWISNNIEAATTDEEIENFVMELEDEASDNKIILNGDVRDILTEKRNELVEELKYQ